MLVQAVVFDVGETLVDETRVWSAWADHLGVPRLTFFALLGAVIARGGDHREVFRAFRPGIDLRAELESASRQDLVDVIGPEDLYADALPCLEALDDAGYRLGVAGNQPGSAETMFRDLDLGIELVASSETWGVAKPDPAFFGRIASELALPPGDIAYVGDRLDNDIGPAARAGMVSVFIRRGPWAWIQAGRTAPNAMITIESLTELPRALARLR
jgi:HAD superfamily hydrolase (TIGR01549 family)